jgi:hypothetical protein
VVLVLAFCKFWSVLGGSGARLLLFLERVRRFWYSLFVILERVR